jgi:8-hydroxy-5-deazaflavin:NADPH oxidoreductase
MRQNRFLPLALLVSLTALVTPGVALAVHTIAVIGTGDVAAALGPEFAKQGHTIVYGSRDPARAEVEALVARTGANASAATQSQAAARADIVVLAVPGAVAEQVTRDLGDLSGKIILDPTNRVGRMADGTPFHDVPGKGSNAELIQAAAPGARVVKAFNTLNWRQMVDPLSSGGPVSIPIVGDDADAKAAIAELIRGMDGLEVIDLGPLSYAYVLEGMLVVWANALRSTPFNYHLRRQPAN